MPLLPQDETLLAHLAEQHGIELSEDELKAIATWQYDWQTTPKLAAPVDVQNGKLGTVLAFGVAGFFLGPLIGIGALAGALAFASIAWQLFAKKSKKKEEKFAQAYGFDAATALVQYGSPVPLVYANRQVNPAGGVRMAGYLINSRVDTVKGAQRLYTLTCLGLGTLGRISETDVLIDDQPLDKFLSSEYETTIRLGSFNQPAIANFPVYSAVSTPSTTSTLGCDKRSEVKSSTTNTDDSPIVFSYIAAAFQPSTNPSDFQKNAATIAIGRSQEFISSGSGYVRATVLDNSIGDKGFGFTIHGIPTDAAQWHFLIRFRPDGHFAVTELGVVVFSSGTAPDPPTYFPNDVFQVEYDAGSVVFKRNGSTFYVSGSPPVYPVGLGCFIADIPPTSANGVRFHDLRLARNISTTTGSVDPDTATTTVTVDGDDFERFTPSDVYQVGTTVFRILDKNEGSNSLTTDATVDLPDGAAIFAIYKANYETTKPVSRIDFNLFCQLWARNEKGDLKSFGQVFDVWIKRLPGGSYQFLKRLCVKAKNPNGVRRSLKIKNLPKSKYAVELRPVPRITDGQGANQITDNGVFVTLSTSVVFSGQTVQIEVEGGAAISVSSANDLIKFDGDNRKQVSTENGAPIKITSINEVVTPESRGELTVAEYNGFALAGMELLASDRLSGAPSFAWLLELGRICKQHLAAGSAGVGSSGVILVDLTANFTAYVFPGNIVRNLDKGVASVIDTVAVNSVTTFTSLDWESSDRYLIYNFGSSTYFPDVYCDTLLSEWGGLGVLIDGDEFVDYPSIVKARRFCVANQYFWDGVIDRSIPWSQWVTQEAPSSLLYPSRIAGRYALIPEEPRPVSGVFNAGNIIKQSFSEEYVDWVDSETNTMVVTYRDGETDSRFKEKTVTIQTPEAFAGTVIRQEETISALGITRRDQAIDHRRHGQP